MKTGRDIFPESPELRTSIFYHCEPCEAWVGCHKGTLSALGSPAKKDLRILRKRAHAKFDRLWQGHMIHKNVTKSKARNKAYKWLADELEIRPGECHIGQFDADACLQVLAICKRAKEEVAA